MLLIMKVLIYFYDDRSFSLKC